jgi:hypothetical protein
MLRIYNPNSGEHFYTKDENERRHLILKGWLSEGIGWVAPTTGKNVYRLYNKNGGEHYYTLSIKERNKLVKLKWRYEGVGWKSGGKTKIYCQYNKNQFANNHNFTPVYSEHKNLVRKGWKSQGVAWYASASTKKVTIQQDTAYVSEEAVMNLNGWGGQHVKLRLVSPGGVPVASLGLQRWPGGTWGSEPYLIMENVTSHASEPNLKGKEYAFIASGGFLRGVDVKIRFSWYRDGTLKAFVNDIEYFSTPSRLKGLFQMGVEGSIRYRGETIDAWCKDIVYKAGELTDPNHMGTYVDSFVNYWGIKADVYEGEVNNSYSPFNTHLSTSYKSSVHFTGVSNLPPWGDWDNAASLRSGLPKGQPPGAPSSAIVKVKQYDK